MNVPLQELPTRIGTVIPGTKGKLTQLWPAKSGDGQHGPWQLQNGMLEDETGFKMKITFKNLPELPQSARGSMIELESVGGRNGMQGVKVKADERTAAPLLWITSTAIIRGIPLGGAPAQVSITPRPATRPVQSTLPLTDGPDVTGVRKRMMQLANLYDISRNAAEYIMAEHKVEDEESIRACTSCLFIQGTREQLDRKLPEKPIETILVTATKVPVPPLDDEEKTWGADPTPTDSGPEQEDPF